MSRARRTLCGDRACRSALAVAPCEYCLALGEPSAEIVRVEALSLWRRANLSRARRALCGDRACRSAVAVAPCKVQRALPHLRLRRQRLRTKLARKVRSRICGLKFAYGKRVRSSGCKIALFKYKSSTQRALRSSGCKIAILSSKVVREMHSRSSGSKFATSRYKSSLRRTFPQLRLKACKFQVQK